MPTNSKMTSPFTTGFIKNVAYALMILREHVSGRSLVRGEGVRAVFRPETRPGGVGKGNLR